MSSHATSKAESPNILNHSKSQIQDDDKIFEIQEEDK